MWDTRTTDTSSSSIMGVLFIIIIIWAIFGGGLFGNNRAYASEAVGCNRVSNCEVEKQTIINTATTQNLIQSEAAKGREQATSLYIQDQATQLFDCKMKGMEERILTGQAIVAKDSEIAILKQQIGLDARFNMLERNQERIACEMLKEPKVYGQAFTCSGTTIPNNCGF